MEAKLAGLILRIHAVDDERMGMHVHIERRSEPLDDGDAAAPSARNAQLGDGPPAQRAEHAPDEDANHGAAQPMVEGQRIA